MNKHEVHERWTRITSERAISQTVSWAREQIPAIPSSTKVEISRRLTNAAGNASSEFIVKLSYSILGNVEGNYDDFKKEVIQTLKHELAHIAEYATYRDAGHGAEWGYFMAKLDAELRRYHYHKTVEELKKDRFYDTHQIRLRTGLKVLLSVNGKALMGRIVKVNRTRYRIRTENGDYDVPMDYKEVVVEGSDYWNQFIQA